MDNNESQLRDPKQTPARNGGMCNDQEADTNWDRLTDEDRLLIWLTASGMDDHEIAADCAETPRKLARRYRTLLAKLGLADRLSLVLATVARTVREPAARRLAGGALSRV